MARGDRYEATAAGTTDLHYVDTGMYDVPEYGSIYLLAAERPAVVDTGIGRHPELIVDALGDLGIAPSALEVIAPTHVHLDHAGGAGYLAEACPNAEIYVHERGARHLAEPDRLWAGTKAAVGDEIQFYGEPKPVPEDRITPVTDGDVIDLGDHTLAVHHAPGHAPHQVVFYDTANDGIFTADAAGIHAPAMEGVQPTTPPPDFDLEQCLADVAMLQDLDPAALYYGHFGDAPTADRLAEYASVLEEWVEAVAALWRETGDEAAVIERLQASSHRPAAWGQRKADAEIRMNARGVLEYLQSAED